MVLGLTHRQQGKQSYAYSASKVLRWADGQEKKITLNTRVLIFNNLNSWGPDVAKSAFPSLVFYILSNF